MSSFNLDFVGLTVEDIAVNEQPAAFSRNGQELTITPAMPLKAGDFFTVEVTYSGAPEQISRSLFPC